jgi:hypothetical protein
LSGFKDAVAADVRGVFLNLGEFAEPRTVVYDGETYADIPAVLSGVRERDRRILEDDHAQGLYRATVLLHCAVDDLGGKTPEQGQRLRIGGGDGGFLREFRVADSVCRAGLLRVALEAIDE